ncbi:MAG: ribonuclease P protein component [Hyphomicrobiales bacterium]
MAMAGKLRGGEPNGNELFGRLRRAAEFQGLRRGKRIEAEFGRLQGVVRARDSETGFALRFGLIVPKRLGNAPQRNRIKRRLRAALRQAERSGCFAGQSTRQGSAAAGVDIGIFPSSSVLAMNFEALETQLCSSIGALMRKLGWLPI